MTKRRPIIVTGAHRSGTTWTGMILSQAPGIRYINEPFNTEYYQSYSPIKHAYEFVAEDSNSAKIDAIKNYLDSFLQLQISQLRNEYAEVSQMEGRRFFAVSTIKKLYARPLFKAPFMLLSLEWIAKQYNPEIVIVIRHPAAFVASLKKAKWSFDFNHLVNQQKLLKQSHFGTYADQLMQMAENPGDIVDQGILLWNCLYYKVLGYQEKYANEWHFIRHRDFSLNPIDQFKSLFSALNLRFTDKEEAKIIETTTAAEASYLNRDAHRNLNTWKTRLSAEEIKRIRLGTAELSPHFYSDEEW